MALLFLANTTQKVKEISLTTLIDIHCELSHYGSCNVTRGVHGL